MSDIIDDITVLEGSWTPDERVVIVTETAAHAFIQSGDLDEAVQKTLAAMSLTGQRVSVLSVEPA